MGKTRYACLLLGLFYVFAVGCGHSVAGDKAIGPRAETVGVDHLDEPGFLYTISRYVCPMPAKATESTKFDARFDTAYRTRAENARLDAYYESPDGYVYFLVSRVAPSLAQKRVATGGRLKYGPDNASLSAYEEVFRTWRMEEEELGRKGKMLFQAMLEGKSLEPYYTKKGQSEDWYIEFPDSRTYYDTSARQWTFVKR